MLTRRRIRSTIALLLPVMVLRALLPAGFMPVAEQGELRMVMCVAGVLVQDGDAGGNTGQPHQLPGAAGDCLFAHAAAAAPPAQLQVAPVEPPREIRLASLTADTLPPATGPPRAATARAPPALS